MKTSTFKILLLGISAAFTFSMTSCSDDNFEISNTQVQLSYLDADGLDMLDTTQNFDPKKVDIYYMINGVKTRINDSNASLPENFYLYHSDLTTNFALVIFANNRLDSENKSVTLIDFGTRVDTLTTGFKVWDAGLRIEQVWLNDELLTSKLDHEVPLVITVDQVLTGK